MSYLADQYGKNVRLYPRTPTGRALVNHRLHFDIGTLYRGMKDYYVSVREKKCIYIYICNYYLKNARCLKWNKFISVSSRVWKDKGL